MKEPYRNAHNTLIHEGFFITDDDVLVCLTYANKIHLPVFEHSSFIWRNVQAAFFVIETALGKAQRGL